MIIYNLFRTYYYKLSRKLQLFLLQILFYSLYGPMMLLYLLLIINVKYLIPILSMFVLSMLFVLCR